MRESLNGGFIVASSDFRICLVNCNLQTVLKSDAAWLRVGSIKNKAIGMIAYENIEVHYNIAYFDYC